MKKILSTVIYLLLAAGSNPCLAEGNRLYLICDTTSVINYTGFDFKKNPEKTEKKKSSVLIDLSSGIVLEGSFAEGSDKLKNFKSGVGATRIWGGGNGKGPSEQSTDYYLEWNYHFDRGTGAFEVAMFNRSSSSDRSGWSEMKIHEFGTCLQNQVSKF
jgi:hypothetical protein